MIGSQAFSIIIIIILSKFLNCEQLLSLKISIIFRFCFP